MSTEEIRSIVPCQGEWLAKYRDKTTGEEHEYPIACWALIIEHLDESEQHEFEIKQFEWVRGLIPLIGNQNLIEPYDELPENVEFLGYEKIY